MHSLLILGQSNRWVWVGGLVGSSGAKDPQKIFVSFSSLWEKKLGPRWPKNATLEGGKAQKGPEKPPAPVCLSLSLLT
jgi:hypothetical protein